MKARASHTYFYCLMDKKAYVILCQKIGTEACLDKLH
jgi:hypothetical protein